MLIGAGLLGLPFALEECGFVFGIILFLIVGLIDLISVDMLICTGAHVAKFSYEDLCKHCFGQPGFICIALCMMIFAFGGMCAYLIIIGDTMSVVFEYGFNWEIGRNTTILTFTLLCIVPLCMVRDMRSLSWSSALSMLAMLILVIYICVTASERAAEYPEPIEPTVTFANANTFAGLGVISYAFVYHHSSFIVFNTLKKRNVAVFRKVNIFSISTALFFALLLSITSYLNFYGKTRANILNNFSCSSALFARFLLALTMAMTFPMEHFVTRQSLYSL